MLLQHKQMQGKLGYSWILQEETAEILKWSNTKMKRCSSALLEAGPIESEGMNRVTLVILKMQDADTQIS